MTIKREAYCRAIASSVGHRAFRDPDQPNNRGDGTFMLFSATDAKQTIKVVEGVVVESSDGVGVGANSVDHITAWLLAHPAPSGVYTLDQSDTPMGTLRQRYRQP